MTSQMSSDEELNEFVRREMRIATTYGDLNALLRSNLDMAVPDANISFPNQSRQETISGSVMLALERCVKRILYVDYGELLREEDLIAVMASDFHGDTISFLLPLALSGNFRIVRSTPERIYGRTDPKCVCVLDGDFCAQDPEYVLERYKKRITETNKDTVHATVEQLAFRATAPVMVMNSIVEFLIHQETHARRVFAVLGNHDEEFPIHSQLDILLLMETTNGTYMIQHGLFALNLYRPTRHSAPFDDDVLRVVYDPLKLERVYDQDDVSIRAIHVSTIAHELRTEVSPANVRSKYAARIVKDGKNVNDLLRKLYNTNIEPIDIQSMFQYKLKFDGDRLDEIIKDFLDKADIHGDAFFVLGHSYGYLGFLFTTDYRSFTTENDIPFGEDIVETDTIFKNVLTLDSGCTSLMNKCIEDEVKGSVIKGGAPNTSQLGLLILVLVVIIVFIVIVVRRGQLRPIDNPTLSDDDPF